MADEQKPYTMGLLVALEFHPDRGTLSVSIRNEPTLPVLPLVLLVGEFETAEEAAAAVEFALRPYFRLLMPVDRRPESGS